LNATAYINYFAVKAFDFFWVKLEHLCPFSGAFYDFSFSVDVVDRFVLLLLEFTDGPADFYADA
jgi:hypothetical protein